MERTLLLVDDEPHISSSLTRMLRRYGYRILVAGSGREGLEILAQHPVGVVVSDQRMPEMTGTEFLSRVCEIYPDTIRIVLSGYTDLNSVTDAINRGAIYKFLTKPWEDDLLQANIEEAFALFEMRTENARLTRQLQDVNDELGRINAHLEQRVQEKTQQAMLGLHLARVGQGILDLFPFAVIGIDSEGQIAIANRRANELFGPTLVGENACACIPSHLLDVPVDAGTPAPRVFGLADGREGRYWRYRIDEDTTVYGSVLVAEVPQQLADSTA